MECDGAVFLPPDGKPLEDGLWGRADRYIEPWTRGWWATPPLPVEEAIGKLAALRPRYWLPVYDDEAGVFSLVFTPQYRPLAQYEETLGKLLRRYRGWHVVLFESVYDEEIGSGRP